MANRKAMILTGLAAGGAFLASSPAKAQYSPTPEFTGHIGRTVGETKTAYPLHNPKAKPGSPNVVWIVLDDTGFGVSSAFGGLVETPTFDYLAQNGLTFNNYHSAAISAATRACLLTGRNHHDNHTGRFNDDQYGAPGYDTYMPMENGTIAEILSDNGYATFCVGKYNGTPFENASNAGPFNRWPLSRGFDHYFGFNPASGGEDQWHPILYRDTHRVPDNEPGQVVVERFADEAINYIADQKSAAPDQPFFLYFATGTTHRPFHVTKEWIDKYHGCFDSGWDEYSKKVLKRQIEMGVVPKGTELAIVNKDVPAWDSLSDDEKKLFSRQMEVFAGFMGEADYHIGRIIDFIRRIGELDNTLVIVVLGDNGASGEGDSTGLMNSTPEKNKAYIQEELKKYDHYGDERTLPFYPAGWAQACNTPFRYYKKWPDYEGGTHDGLIVFYPKGIVDKGGIRTQYTHCTDILPTTVELTGSTVPQVIDGYPQTEISGTSFAYAVTSKDNNVKDRKTFQYYELNSSYALYKDGWKVQFPNGAVNGLRAGIYPDTGVHLYNLKKDFNESKDLAAKYPGKVNEMLKEFDDYAWKHNIYPLKNGKVNIDPDYPSKLRPHYDIFVGARDFGEYPFFEGTGGRPYTLTVYIDKPGTSGVLISQKEYALYVLDGKLVYGSSTGEKLFADRPLPSGECVVKVVADHKGKKSTISLYIDDVKVGSKEFSTKINAPGKSNAIQVGRQWGVPVNDDYESPFMFNGKIFKASIDIQM